MGIGMGGCGAWDLLIRHGSRFAAGVPVCGCTDPSRSSLLKRIPLWLFHGSEDKTVLPEGSRCLFAKVRKEGGDNIRYTEYNGVGHEIAPLVYNDRDLQQWLFVQSRLARRLLAEKKAKQKKTAILTGSGAGEVPALLEHFQHIPNLQLRDCRREKTDPFAAAGEDTLQGAYFQRLKDAYDDSDEATQAQIRLAAEISQDLLEGREVSLP
jgi:hypothetical protein